MDFWDFFWLMLIYVPLIMMWTFALVDIFRRDDLSGASKAVWLVVIFALPFLGTLIYTIVNTPGSDRRGSAYGAAAAARATDPYSSAART